MTGAGRGASLLERDARVIADIGRLRFAPLNAVGGRGARLIEEGGREILDLSASWGAAILGYGHPAVVDAVVEASSRMAGATLLSCPNEPAVALAEDLLALTPGRGERRVWFGHSGSDANDCAVRTIQAATGRSRFISFIGSYHGNSSGSMSVSGHTSMTHTLPRPGLLLLPYPDPYRREFDAAEVLKLLDFHFATSCPPQQVAAVFIEPLMSDGGLIVPPPGFLAAVQERCRRHGILVVVDEVKVGLGRSGRLHCFEHEGLHPDVVIFGKGLGGGLPLSAVVGPKEVMDHAGAFAIQTTGGNPVAAAAGRAVLRVITGGAGGVAGSDAGAGGAGRTDGLIERARSVGGVLSDGLRKLGERHAIIGDVRGRGLAIGVDLVRDRTTREPVAVATTAKVIYRAHALGAAFFYVGMRGNVLEFTPPLTLTDAEAREGVAILDAALGDVARGLVSDAEVAPYMMW